jgi:hypothetical protein
MLQASKRQKKSHLGNLPLAFGTHVLSLSKFVAIAYFVLNDVVFRVLRQAA